MSSAKTTGLMILSLAILHEEVDRETWFSDI
jgi:hypothetical protein